MGDQQKHFPFSASSAHRWVNCPGSWQLEKLAPVDNSGNESARLGTAVHAMVEEGLSKVILSGNPDDLNDRGTSLEYASHVLLDTSGDFKRFLKFGETDSNGYMIPIDDKMVTDAQLCLDLVAAIFKKRPNATVYSEYKSILIPDTLGGTADIVVIDGDWGCVIDYKNGVGHVDVEHNLQLQTYALGIMECLKNAEHVKKWTLAIVQPNDKDDPGAVRTWKTTTAELGLVYQEVHDAVSMCHRDNAPTKVGPWCKWCKAVRCPRRDQALLKTAQKELPDLPRAGTEAVGEPDPTQLSDDQLGWILENLSMIKNHIKNLETEALNRLKSGGLGGFKLVRKRSQRKVADEAGLISAAKKENWEVTREVLRTLRDLDKEVPKNELAKFVTKPDGDITWAPEGDKRPAVDYDPTVGLSELTE